MMRFNTDEAHVIGILLKKTLQIPISNEQRQELFQKLTKEQPMDYKMFLMIVSALDFEVFPEMTVEELFRKVNFKNDDVIDEDEFSFLLSILSFHILMEMDHFSCGDLFELFDYKCTNTITKREFDHFFSVIGDAKFSKSGLDALFAQIDYHNTGFISFDEWVHGMFNKQLYKKLGFQGDRIHLTRREFKILYCAKSGADLYEANMKFFEIDLKQTGFIDLPEMEKYMEALQERAAWENFICTGDMVLIVFIIIFVIALGIATISEPNLVDLMEVLIGCAEIYFFSKLATQEIMEYRADIEILAYMTKALKKNPRKGRDINIL